MLLSRNKPAVTVVMHTYAPFKVSKLLKETVVHIHAINILKTYTLYNVFIFSPTLCWQDVVDERWCATKCTLDFGWRRALRLIMLENNRNTSDESEWFRDDVQKGREREAALQPPLAAAMLLLNFSRNCSSK